MIWIAVILGFLAISSLGKQLSSIYSKLTDIENQLSDLDSEFQDRFPRNDIDDLSGLGE